MSIDVLNDFKFGGIVRLYGLDGVNVLVNSYVCIVGIGGVGSWCVELLVCFGVGELMFIDLDDVCVINMNR